jgi:hypothetical protein
MHDMPPEMRVLDRFIDVIIQMEIRRPNIAHKPGAKSRSIPDDLIQELRMLADRADDILSSWRKRSRAKED